MEVARQGVLVVRIDFVAALDEGGDANLTVCYVACRLFVPVPEGVVAFVVGARQGDFCPFGVFFHQGGDDGFVCLLA